MTVNKRDYLLYRSLEIFPGALVWSTLAFLITLSLIRPIWAIYFIIIFDLYWLVRISYLMIYIFVSWRRFRSADIIDWQKKLATTYGPLTNEHWNDYWHIVFLPTYTEPYEIVSSSIDAIAQCAYGNKKRIILMLAGEERDQEHFKTIAERITREYGHIFHSINVTLHKKNIPGDMPGKGSNLYHTGHAAQALIDELGIDYKKIIVSTFDIDTVVHKQYFSYLTYHFLQHPNPHRASFQPLTLYHNNIWESDPITRVVANSTTFWLLTDLARSDRLFTFSSHSMSWQALVDVGFWQNNIVTEDSRIFLQSLIHYNGDYEVFPMYITVSMNTVFQGSFIRSLINQYKQMLRWAYGVEHFPYMVWHFYNNKKIPFKKKLSYLWNQTEGVYSWATAPLIMLIVGHLPLMVANASRDTSFISQQAPLILSWTMTFAMWGLIVIAVFSTLIVPRRPVRGLQGVLNYIIMLVQWILFPVTMVLFGSLPAIDAQTRLMIGKYLDFHVTEKKRRITSPPEAPPGHSENQQSSSASYPRAESS